MGEFEWKKGDPLPGQDEDFSVSITDITDYLEAKDGEIERLTRELSETKRMLEEAAKERNLLEKQMLDLMGAMSWEERMDWADRWASPNLGESSIKLVDKEQADE